MLSAIGFFPGVSDVMESNHLFIPCAYLSWILSSTEALVAPISNSPFLALTCEAPTLPHQLWSYSAHWPPWPIFHVPDGRSMWMHSLLCSKSPDSRLQKGLSEQRCWSDNPHSARKEVAPARCPLPSTNVHVCAHTHILNKCSFKKKDSHL